MTPVVKDKVIARYYILSSFDTLDKYLTYPFSIQS